MADGPPTRGAARFFSRIVIPMLDRWRGSHARKYVPEYEARYRLAADELAARQLEDLRALLVHAYASSPFHRRRMDEAGFDAGAVTSIDDLGALPALTKAQVIEHADDIASSAIGTTKLVRATSGGTTGEPVPFFQTQDTIDRKNAQTMALQRLMGWFDGSRSVYLWGALGDLATDLEGWRRVKSDLIDWHVERCIGLPGQSLDAETLDRYVNTLRKFRPHVLQGYPSSTDLLARRLVERNASLHIPLVVLTAEPAYDDQRERIGAALNANVLTFYGARELGWIASECAAEHVLHLNTAGSVVETTDDGRLLVTDLLNDAFPMIRFEIGDRGALGDTPCRCGDPRPVLARLEGRESDCFVLPSGRIVPGVSMDVRGIQQDAMGILDVQLVQSDPRTLDVNWVPATNFEPRHLDAYLDLLRRFFDGELEIRAHRVDEIAPEPNGKVRYMISRVPLP